MNEKRRRRWADGAKKKPTFREPPRKWSAVFLIATRSSSVAPGEHHRFYCSISACQYAN